MNGFGEANSKLFNEIFAEEGENQKEEVLDGVEDLLASFEVEMEENDQEEVVSDIFTEEEESASESQESEEKEDEKKEEDKQSDSVTKSTATFRDDIVSNEATMVMTEEKRNGTLTLITEGTTIDGNISLVNSLEVQGTITGGVDCQGKVYINGNVSGSITGTDIYVNTPRLVGDLKGEGAVKVGVGTVIIGDISGKSAYIAGAVKGNIEVDGPVEIDSTAIVQGDIKAKPIQINNGAIIEGFCKLNHTGIDVDDVFAEK